MEETRPGNSSLTAAEVLEKHRHHYETDMAGIPEPQRMLAATAPEFFDGYATMRTWLLGSEAPGRLPLKYRHLVLVVTDCVVHNLEGAMNHARAAVRAGLTADEMADAMVALIIGCGTPAWGQYGRKVLAMVRELEGKGSAS